MNDVKSRTNALKPAFPAQSSQGQKHPADDRLYLRLSLLPGGPDAAQSQLLFRIRYLMDMGYKNAAGIALSHSFQIKRLSDYIGPADIPKQAQEEMKMLLEAQVQGDYGAHEREKDPYELGQTGVISG